MEALQESCRSVARGQPRSLGHSQTLYRNPPGETALAPPSDGSIAHVRPPNSSLAVGSSLQFTKGFAFQVEKQTSLFKMEMLWGLLSRSPLLMAKTPLG